VLKQPTYVMIPEKDRVGPTADSILRTNHANVTSFILTRGRPVVATAIVRLTGREWATGLRLGGWNGRPHFTNIESTDVTWALALHKALSLA
jgi:hypothetical protein